MKRLKKDKVKNKSLIDILGRSNTEVLERLDLVNRFPLKEPVEIVMKNSDWQVIKKRPTSNKGVASFVM